MASTAEQLTNLVNENIEVDGQTLTIPEDLNISLLGSGVSSMDIVALANLIMEEFGVEFALDDCFALETLRDVVAFIDSKTA
ncbi:MAG: acyl carrier protein [Acidimicrobiia bacterium]|nr:acyl carrier protein [Acidimicrobiia bacterium]